MKNKFTKFYRKVFSDVCNSLDYEYDGNIDIPYIEAGPTLLYTRGIYVHDSVHINPFYRCNRYVNIDRELYHRVSEEFANITLDVLPVNNIKYFINDRGEACSTFINTETGVSMTFLRKDLHFFSYTIANLGISADYEYLVIKYSDYEIAAIHGCCSIDAEDMGD